MNDRPPPSERDRRRPKPWASITRLDVHYQDDGPSIRVGGLAADRRGRVYFQYDAAWLTRGVELSPYQLPLALGSAVTAAPDPKRLHGLHGLFADAMPDDWGTRVLDGALRRAGIVPDQAGPLDRLAWLGDRAMGALTYRPAHAWPGDAERAVSLDVLAAQAQRVVDGAVEPTGAAGEPSALDLLQRAAGTAGGAQPKVLVALSPDGRTLVAGADPPPGSTPYLVKFTPPRDGLGLRTDSGPLEEAYARMARAAGIDVPPSRLLATTDGRQHFAVERFDRTRVGGRRHVHTLGGLLGREAGDEGDYDDLLRWARQLTGDARVIEAGIRRLWFNLTALNDDDHLKNVAFLLDPDDGWALAPAYDLTYTPSRAGERGMSVAGHAARIRWATVVALAERHGIRPARTSEIRAEVDAAVAAWLHHAGEAQVPPASAAEVGGALAQRRTVLDAG